jgi:hypothetical protein
MSKPDTKLANEMQLQLLERYGPLLSGAALHQALGFPSAGAMRQAAIRNQVGVRLFSIANRRGKFALTRDVAQWLASCVHDVAEGIPATLEAVEEIQLPADPQATAAALGAKQSSELQPS